MAARRVAITGIGLLSALGTSRAEVWRNMVAGRCGIREVTQFDPAGYRSRLAAEIGDLDATRRCPAVVRRRWSRCDELAVLATAEALEDAGLDREVQNPERIAVMLGAGTSDLVRSEEFLADVRTKGLARARLSQVNNFFSSTPVDVIGRHFGFFGPRHCFVAACSSSTIAIGRAADAIRSNEIDVAVAGGADVLCRLTFSGFNALRLVDVEPCRPFDTQRGGMTIGEAAAIVILEDLERACARGATVYAELAGYSTTCEAYHPTSPEPEGIAIARTIAAALADARIGPDTIDHVNAHGTGTIHNDRAEARAFHRVFGGRMKSLPVTSIKSMVGHCLGAAGAIEAAALALTIATGVIPPTIGHRETDPECALDIVANDARDETVQCGLSTSLAFGGNDAALVIRRVS